MSEQRTWEWDGDGEAQWLISPDGKRVWVDEAAGILNALEADNARYKAALEEIAGRVTPQMGEDVPTEQRIARTALTDSREGEG